MGLDAVVYCDCWERGAIRRLPEPQWQIYIDEQYGSRDASTNSSSADIEFDRWNRWACEHENGILLHHRLGNIALIGFVHEQLERAPEKFSFLLSRVVYSGIHSGDVIAVAELPQVEVELPALADVHCELGDDEALLRCFEHQMHELARAARQVSKPICF
jgi:hypothetical protein